MTAKVVVGLLASERFEAGSLSRSSYAVRRRMTSGPRSVPGNGARAHGCVLFIARWRIVKDRGGSGHDPLLMKMPGRVVVFCLELEMESPLVHRGPFANPDYLAANAA